MGRELEPLRAKGRDAPALSNDGRPFARALAIRPNDPWTNNDLGVAHRWLGTTLAESGGDPMPELANFISPGLAFASAMNSFKPVAGTLLATTIVSQERAMALTGAKSFTGS